MTCARQDAGSTPDPHVARLAGLFASHPAWRDAARRIRVGACSRVLFSHRPSEVWHLVSSAEGSQLVPGPGVDPDFVFRFTPGAIDRLCSVDGGVGEFAAELFERMVAEEDDTRVDLRLIASFRRLASRGYLGLLLAAAPRLAAQRARHGVKNLGDLRRLIDSHRRRIPEPWERWAESPESNES